MKPQLQSLRPAYDAFPSLRLPAAYKRAKAFYSCLALEGSVASTGIEPLLLWTLSMERLLTEWPTRGNRMQRFFPKNNGAGTAQLACMADIKSMWDAAVAGEPEARPRYQARSRMCRRK